MTTGASLWADAPLLAIGASSDPTPTATLTEKVAWWKVTAPESGTFGFDTEQSDIAETTVITVYRDVDGTEESLVQVGGGSWYPQEAVALEAGQTYYVRVGTFSPDDGTYVLRFRRTILVEEFSPGMRVEYTIVTASHDEANEEVTPREVTFQLDETGQQLTTLIEGADFFHMGGVDGQTQEQWDFLTGRLNAYRPQADALRYGSFFQSLYGKYDWLTGPVFIVGHTTPPNDAFHPRSVWPEGAVAIEFAQPALTRDSVEVSVTATVLDGSGWIVYFSNPGITSPATDNRWPSSLIEQANTQPLGTPFSVPYNPAKSNSLNRFQVVAVPHEVTLNTPPEAGLDHQTRDTRLTLRQAYVTSPYRYLMAVDEDMPEEPIPEPLELEPAIDGALKDRDRQFV